MGTLVVNAVNWHAYHVEHAQTTKIHDTQEITTILLEYGSLVRGGRTEIRKLKVI